MQFKLQELAARWDEQGHRYTVLPLQNGVRIAVAERGGRIFGPFLGDDAPGLFWVNPVYRTAASYTEFLASGNWNQGGERVWISPETQYLVSDRSDFWGTVAVPPAMDPGTWTLDQPAAGQCRLRQSMTLEAYNLASGQKALHVERLIRRAADPLANVKQAHGLLEGVTFAGYEQVVTLREEASDAITSQIWDLVQLEAGGRLVVPATPQVEVTDYNEPIDEEHLRRHGHWLDFKITGVRRFKVGLRAAHTFGRLAYFNAPAGEIAYLLVRNFFNNPSAAYTEEPADLPGSRGESIHIYNDGGMFGGFGELEVQGQTIGGDAGHALSRDQLLLWVYAGPAQQLAAIAAQLLGTERLDAEGGKMA